MVNDPRVRTPPRNVCKFDMLLRGEEQSRGRKDGCELVARSSSKTTEPLSLIFPGQAQRRKATGKSQIESGFVGKERLL